jgi:hypothetical protein
MLKSTFIFLGLILLVSGHHHGGVRQQSLEQYDIEQLLRTVCSTDSEEDVFISWNGTVYDMRDVNSDDTQKPEIIFQVSGFNVARCYQVTLPGSNITYWFKSSREIMLYLDKDTGEVLNTWTNPNGVQVPVVHVANNPAQFPLGFPNSQVEYLIGGDFATLTSNIPLYYPNPLYSDEATRPFAPYVNYQATEFFQWHVPRRSLDDHHHYRNEPAEGDNNEKRSYGGYGQHSTTIDDTTISWNRVSPYLPWMNMSGIDGFLQITATATKVDSYDELFPVLRDVVDNVVPVYKHAPSCVLANPSPYGAPWVSQSSWTYFKTYFQNYLNGDTFPIPDTTQTGTCL